MNTMEVVSDRKLFRKPTVNSVIHASSPWEYEREVTNETRPPTWELIEDPSDSMIVGGIFTFIEISKEKNCGAKGTAWDNWCPGTKFRNIRSGKIVEIYTISKYITRNHRPVLKTTYMYKYVKPSNQLELNLSNV